MRSSTLTLVTLILLPLLAIGVQLAFRLDRSWGVLGYSFYKLFFLLPPVVFCRHHRIGVVNEIVRIRNWRRQLPLAVSLGAAAIAIFWLVYFSLGDLLLDKASITQKIGAQFSVTAGTIFVIAPITIFLNSLLEEFFYRGFAFGLLVKRQRWLGYLLPATVFTIQHLLFIYHWVTLLPFVLAVLGLFVLALVLQWLYESADSLIAPWVVHVLGDVGMMGIAVTLLWGELFG